MKLRYTDRTLLDPEIAFDWYESQFPGLGLEFLDCIEEKIKKIQNLPKAYPVHHENFRRALVRKFPFSIFYTIEEQVIVLHAVLTTDNPQIAIPKISLFYQISPENPHLQFKSIRLNN